ncbi:steroid delta-isomerase [Mycolicibacterium acapulense]|nr:steroid delta-isomerase [Mycolicibacterium acapulense]KUI03212.1 steroid delta-isomerase [Mycolicibacterium acapulense]
MASTPDMTATISRTVQRYLQLVASGSADEIADLFADDASIEDPVGSTPHVGSAAIRKFFTSLGDLQRETTLLSLRVCGLEAAFQFAITFDAGDGWMRLEPIDTMTFDGDGHITSVRSYFTATDITREDC